MMRYLKRRKKVGLQSGDEYNDNIRTTLIGAKGACVVKLRC